MRRWYWTVRGLMKSWAPISGFVSPSRASRAICASCGGQVAAGLDAAFADGLARGEELAAGPVGERFDAHRRQHVVGGVQLLAGVDAPLFASQPLPVEQVRAGELDAEAGTAEALERFAVERLCGFAVAR